MVVLEFKWQNKTNHQTACPLQGYERMKMEELFTFSAYQEKRGKNVGWGMAVISPVTDTFEKLIVNTMVGVGELSAHGKNEIYVLISSFYGSLLMK